MRLLKSKLKTNGLQEFMGINIPIIEGGFGEGKKCITDKTISELHKMRNIHIRELINKNIKRFKIGTEYIDLKVIATNDNNLDMLKLLGYTNMQISKSKNIYLLSERGYAKLIKIMDNDLAWDIHDNLIDEYFKMREVIKSITKEQELVLNLYEGGIKAIESHKELTSIEVKKERDRVEKEEELKRVKLELKLGKEIQDAKDGNNKIITLTTLVEMLSIDGLTTTMFNNWLCKRGLGEYIRFGKDKNRTFQPNESFFDYVALKGYSLTGKTVDNRKISVKYSLAMLNRIQDEHYKDLVEFVRLYK